MNVRVGDVVIRNFAGIKQALKVTAVTNSIIQCGAWMFDRATGAEIDTELDWGPPPQMTGSFITLPEEQSP